MIIPSDIEDRKVGREKRYQLTSLLVGAIALFFSVTLGVSNPRTKDAEIERDLAVLFIIVGAVMFIVIYHLLIKEKNKEEEEAYIRQNFKPKKGEKTVWINSLLPEKRAELYMILFKSVMRKPYSEEEIAMAISQTRRMTSYAVVNKMGGEKFFREKILPNEYYLESVLLSYKRSFSDYTYPVRDFPNIKAMAVPLVEMLMVANATGTMIEEQEKRILYIYNSLMPNVSNPRFEEMMINDYNNALMKIMKKKV